MQVFKTGLTRASIWIWVALFALVLTRFVYQIAQGDPELVLLKLVPVAAVATAFVLANRGAGVIGMYVSAVLAVFGPGVYGGIKTMVYGACSASDRITSWTDLGTRWMDAATGILVFAAIATTTGLSRPLIPDKFPGRTTWVAGLSLTVIGFGAYFAADSVSERFQSAMEEVPGAWSTCKAVTSYGLDNAAMGTNLALVSGFQEEIVFTGVALLLLGAAARWKTVVQLALIGGLIRAVLHMYYTIDASWYAVAAVTCWAMLWSGATLLAAYVALRWFDTDRSVTAISLVTVGVVVSHSTGNMQPELGDLSREMVTNGHSAAGLILSLAWAIVYFVGIVGGGTLLAFAVIKIVTGRHSDDPRDNGDELGADRSNRT